jgi:hypothetical protein
MRDQRGQIDFCACPEATTAQGAMASRPQGSMQLESILTCPNCGFQAAETMPLDACQFFYLCKGCGKKLKPKSGDCCVFCSYGSVPCPPVQQGGKITCCS